MARGALALLAAMAFALSLACGDDSGDQPIDVYAGNLAVHAEIANAPSERSLGLGGRDSMAAGEGMLFIFPQPGHPTFWMRGMRFPLDLIWISSDLRVAEITLNIPPPEPGTPDSELTRYVPSAEAQYVLEVNAGVAEQADVLPGDIVAMVPAPPPAED